MALAISSAQTCSALAILAMPLAPPCVVVIFGTIWHRVRGVDLRLPKQIGTYHECPQPLEEGLIRVVQAGVPDAGQGPLQ